MRNAQKGVVGKSERRRPLGSQGVDGMIIAQDCKGVLFGVHENSKDVLYATSEAMTSAG
jgi:hypothetical protein